MAEQPAAVVRRTPWHLWVVGIFALLWSSMGCVDYLMTETRNEAYLKQFSAAQLAFMAAMPAWVIAAWAIAVWGGVAGAVLLLLKRQEAAWVFLASLVAFVLTTFRNYVLASGMQVSGDAFSLAFTAVIFMLCVGFWAYSWAMARRNVLR